MIRIKTFIAPDKFIGINEFITDKKLLNIGCGSNITAKNLEYDIKDIKQMYALDSSREFILAASKRSLDKKNIAFSVASADDLPFTNKVFDVSMLAFVLHHLPFSPRVALNEAARVTKGEIIIFDHIRSSNLIIGLIQMTYWKIMDGGTQYLTENEWDELLKDFIIIKKLRTGKIGLHVIKYVVIQK
jgi:ubiquinone/menaquinone biosynthesis C-methylase UbiE